MDKTALWYTKKEFACNMFKWYIECMYVCMSITKCYNTITKCLLVPLTNRIAEDSFVVKIVILLFLYATN